MRAKYFASLVFCLLIVFAVTQLQFTSYAQPDTPVRLIDQFDHKFHGGQERHGVVKEIAFFANPVRKLDESGNLLAEKRDEAPHLAWYTLEQEEPTENRVVEFTNQFGRQRWTIGEPVYLLVPTSKNGEGPPWQEEVKHFKCYRVLQAEPLGRRVILQDQFDENSQEVVEVKEAKYFCTPVIKVDEGPQPPDIDEYLGGKHLACYQITTQEIEESVKIENQFDKESREIDLEESVMLCVPSDKIAVE